MAYEKFTERARSIIDFASEEATRLGEESVDTVHLLIGMIREGEGVAGIAVFTIVDAMFGKPVTTDFDGEGTPSFPAPVFRHSKGNREQPDGVFMAYHSIKGHALIDRELYLPKCWTEDRQRCCEAGVLE